MRDFARQKFFFASPRHFDFLNVIYYQEINWKGITSFISFSLLDLRINSHYYYCKFRKSKSEELKLLRFGNSNVLLTFVLHSPFINASVYGPMILFLRFFCKKKL